MRCSLAAVLLVLGASGASAGVGSPGPAVSAICSIRWPDTAITVPDLVDAFIVAECTEYAGTTDEGFDACVAGERSGYRATAMMLSDPETGEKAAERYRACRAGLGMHGGRFHRRRAECIGASFRYVWRFEDTTRASIPDAYPHPRTTAELDG